MNEDAMKKDAARKTQAVALRDNLPDNWQNMNVSRVSRVNMPTGGEDEEEDSSEGELNDEEYIQEMIRLERLREMGITDSGKRVKETKGTLKKDKPLKGILKKSKQSNLRPEWAEESQ